MAWIDSTTVIFWDWEGTIMDAAEKERTIAQIVCGDIPATVITKDNMSFSLFLHPPTPKEQAEAAAVYSVEYQRAILLGLSNENDTISDMIALDRWSSQKEIEIEGLQKDIHNIRRGLLDFLFNRNKLEKIRALLRRAENALLERLSQRHELLHKSAEIHALTCQQRYIISQITEKEDGDLFWDTKDDFENFDDISVIIQLCEFFFMRSHMSNEVIRELARSQQWRVYWEICKNTNDLFSGPVSSWSWNQRELAYWSTIYDSVNDAYERPSKDIIVDDDLLDSWFIRQGEKSDKRTQTNMTPQSHKPGRNEEFIMADQEGAKQVYNMNDPGSRAKIRARQKVLARQGSVREQDMPDSQQEMREQLMGMQRKRVKDISRR